MISPQLRYFKEVLGVKSLVLPEDLREQMAVAQTSIVTLSNVAVISEELTNENKELIQKMFASVGITEFTSVSADEYKGEGHLVWIFGSDIQVETQAQVFQLPSLYELLNTKDAKREAWNKIKVLKS